MLKIFNGQFFDNEINLHVIKDEDVGKDALLMTTYHEFRASKNSNEAFSLTSKSRTRG